MDVSVVIPVYARQDAGVRAVRSVMAQAAGTWRELVIVDDASPEPFELPHELASDLRIRLLRLPCNAGESGARNAGVAAAQGEWIAFLDSDDVWFPDKLSRQIAFAAADQCNHADANVLYATGFRQTNEITGKTLDRMPRPSCDKSDFASGVWLSQGSTALFPRALAQRVGPYDTELRRLMDLDWMLRFAMQGGAVKVAPVLGAALQMATRPHPASVEAACAHIERKWLGADATANLTPAMRRRLAAYLDLERAAAYRYAGQSAKSARMLARSFWRVPRAQIPLRRWWREPLACELPQPRA